MCIYGHSSHAELSGTWFDVDMPAETVGVVEEGCRKGFEAWSSISRKYGARKSISSQPMRVNNCASALQNAEGRPRGPFSHSAPSEAMSDSSNSELGWRG